MTLCKYQLSSILVNIKHVFKIFFVLFDYANTLEQVKKILGIGSRCVHLVST